MENNISIEVLKSGEESAFKEVIRMYQKQVLKIAYGYTNDLHDSDDIAQEVFITLYKNLKKIVSAEHLKHYIYRVAVSRSLDFLRRNRFKNLFVRFSQLGENKVNNFPGRADIPEDNIAYSDLNRALEMALNRLSNNQKTVFILKNHEGLSIKEISSITSMGESTVKTHLFRATRKIRAYISTTIMGEK